MWVINCEKEMEFFVQLTNKKLSFKLETIYNMRCCAQKKRDYFNGGGEFPIKLIFFTHRCRHVVDDTQ